MFYSQTYGKLNIEEIPEKMRIFYELHKKYDTEISIVIGSDSQNHNDTKAISVVAIVCEGHGGIFFHRTMHLPKIVDIRMKLHEETQESLEIAEKIVEIMENDERYEEMYLSCPISIHVDAGNSEKGKTKELIPGIVGCVTSMGFPCLTKPNSYVASSIADKLSKPKKDAA